MPKSISSTQTDSFLETLSWAIRRRMTIKEASRVLGYRSPKQLYNRLEGRTPFPIEEILNAVNRLDLNLYRLMVDSGLQRPSVLDPAALLRFFSATEQSLDDEIERLLQEAPEPITASGEIRPPERFFELDELRATKPTEFSDQLSPWLRRCHFSAVSEPSPKNVVAYCSALDLQAAYLANRGRLTESGHIIAHALDLNPSCSPASLYLVQTAAAILRRLGPVQIALALAKMAHSESALTEDRLLEARCLLTIASIHVLLDQDESLEKAERAFLRVQGLVPDGRTAIAAGVYSAYVQASTGRESEAIKQLDSLDWERVVAVPTVAFRWLWIRGRALAKTGDRREAAQYLERALAHHPEHQDPVNLLLVLDGLRQLDTVPRTKLAALARNMRPFFNTVDFRVRVVSEIAVKVVEALEKSTKAPKVDALMQEMHRRLRST